MIGHPIDARDWSDVIEIMHSLAITDLTLLTNNPQKVSVLTDAGFKVKQQNLAARTGQIISRRGASGATADDDDVILIVRSHAILLEFVWIYSCESVRTGGDRG